MTTDSQTNDSLTKVLRWSARVVGLLAVGLFVLFLVESGPRIIPALSWTEPRGVPLLVAMVVAAVGVLVAWRSHPVVPAGSGDFPNQFLTAVVAWNHLDSCHLCEWHYWDRLLRTGRKSYTDCGVS